MANKYVQLRDAQGNNIFPRINTLNVVNDAKFVNETQLAEAIANAQHIKKEIVTALPSVAEAKEDTIYLILKAEGDAGYVEGENIYDEFMLINGKFEKLGNTKVDLTNYYTKEEVDGAIDADVATLKQTVDAYTVNGKQISTDPVLSGADIVLAGYTAVEGGVGIAAEDSINAAFKKIDENFKTLSGDSTESLGAIAGRVTTLEGEMDSAEGRLDDVEDRLDAIDGEAGEIAGIKSRLDAVEGEADVINAALGADLLVAGSVPATLALKANAADVYTKGEVDGIVEGINGNIDLKANAADVYTKDDIDGTVEGINGEIAKKADSETVNAALDKKADAETTYTKTEVDALLISFVEVDPATGEPVVQG